MKFVQDVVLKQLSLKRLQATMKIVDLYARFVTKLSFQHSPETSMRQNVFQNVKINKLWGTLFTSLIITEVHLKIKIKICIFSSLFF